VVRLQKKRELSNNAGPASSASGSAKSYRAKDDVVRSPTKKAADDEVYFN